MVVAEQLEQHPLRAADCLAVAAALVDQLVQVAAARCRAVAVVVTAAQAAQAT